MILKQSIKKYKNTAKVILFVVIFFVPTFFFSNLVQHYHLSDATVIAAKMKHYGPRKNTYDTVFIGSIFLWRSIIPDVYDLEMKKFGIETSSYNLGAQLMPFGEGLYILKTIKRLKPENLKWVIVEYPLYPTLREEAYNTQKFIYWHDLKNSLFCSKIAVKSSFLKFKHDPKQLIENVADKLSLHFHAFLLKTYNKGNGFRNLDLILSDTNNIGKYLNFKYEDTDIYTSYKSVLSKGYLSLERQYGPDSPRHLSFLKKRSEFRKKVNNLKTNAPSQDIHRYLGLYNEITYEIIKLIKTMGAKPIFLVTPSMIKMPRELPMDMEKCQPVPIIRLDDPTGFPSLYDESRRYDEGHLNAQGAYEATVYFAQMLHKHLQN